MFRLFNDSGGAGRRPGTVEISKFQHRTLRDQLLPPCLTTELDSGDHSGPRCPKRLRSGGSQLVLSNSSLLHSTFLLPRERAQFHPRSSNLEIVLRPVPPYEEPGIGGRRVELLDANATCSPVTRALASYILIRRDLVRCGCSCCCRRSSRLGGLRRWSCVPCITASGYPT